MNEEDIDALYKHAENLEDRLGERINSNFVYYHVGRTLDKFVGLLDRRKSDLTLEVADGYNQYQYLSSAFTVTYEMNPLEHLAFFVEQAYLAQDVDPSNESYALLVFQKSYKAATEFFDFLDKNFSWVVEQIEEEQEQSRGNYGSKGVGVRQGDSMKPSKGDAKDVLISVKSSFRKIIRGLDISEPELIEMPLEGMDNFKKDTWAIYWPDERVRGWPEMFTGGGEILGYEVKPIKYFKGRLTWVYYDYYTLVLIDETDGEKAWYEDFYILVGW